MSEFRLIERFFQREQHPAWLRLGIGDDAAVIDPPAGRQLVSTIDTLVEGRHFPVGTEAGSIGWKALAVNASDLVAMAADPTHFLLALTLPDADEAWLERFSDGLFRAADSFAMTLVGGDTTRGPLAVSIQANGWTDAGACITRDGAQIGDDIWLSGRLGDAALALALLQGRVAADEVDAATTAACYTALNYPRPRIELIPLLRRHARAAIDVSDGLAADLGHLLDRSGVGAVIEAERLPLNDWYRSGGDPGLALGGGDDYEILFTAPPEATTALRRDAEGLPFALTRIGRVIDSGAWLVTEGQQRDLSEFGGYDHFPA